MLNCCSWLVFRIIPTLDACVNLMPIFCDIWYLGCVAKLMAPGHQEGLANLLQVIREAPALNSFLTLKMFDGRYHSATPQCGEPPMQYHVHENRDV